MKPEARDQRSEPCGALVCLLALLSLGFSACAVDLPSLRADRAAIERVHYNHRLGEKPPFEQVLPPLTLENLVERTKRKQTMKTILALFGSVWICAASAYAQNYSIDWFTIARHPEW